MPWMLPERERSRARATGHDHPSEHAQTVGHLLAEPDAKEERVHRGRSEWEVARVRPH